MPPRLPEGTTGTFRQVYPWLGMPGHTQPEEVASNATFLWWICPYKKKIKKMTYYFQKYLWSENQAIWLDQGILGHNLWSRIFPYIGFEQDYYIFHFRLLPWKWNLKILWKLKKTPFWTPFAKRKIRFCHFFMFLDLSCCAGFF